MFYHQASFLINNITEFKQQILSWANQFNICCFLDNNQYNLPHSNIECLVAVNPIHQLNVENNSLQQLQKFITQHQKKWIFGHVSFEVKDEIYNTTSKHENKVNFPLLYFFIPEIVIELKNNQANFYSTNNNVEELFTTIKNSATTTTSISSNKENLTIQSKISKQTYLAAIEQLQQHIKRGDCYEINFCQEFFAQNVNINPIEVYQQLSKISPNPFACFYKLNENYLMCASPERFIKKQDNTVISQPIKGTIKRNTANKKEDELLKQQLLNSKKDCSENVMIVDLVRNDLSKICKEGSVKVDELFGIYTFPQVHQMISTITGEVEKDINFASVLQATFPMGSMTGAPKKRVLELTEQYEKSKRGIYSGTVGYISPENNFDFNVVIRSIMYNAVEQYLSYQVGGGITFYSNAENEYEECLLKAEAIRKVLS